MLTAATPPRASRGGTFSAARRPPPLAAEPAPPAAAAAAAAASSGVALLRRRVLLRTILLKSLVDAAGLPGPVPADVDEEPAFRSARRLSRRLMMPWLCVLSGEKTMKACAVWGGGGEVGS